MRQFDDAPSLVVTTPSLRGVRIGLGASRTTVGRSDECDGILDDPTVSRRHAVIEIFGGAMTLRDLGSRNGTSVNGHPVVGSVRLHPGDVVAFGSVETLVEMPGARGGAFGSYAAGPPFGSHAAGPPSGPYAAGPPSGSHAAGPPSGPYAAGPPSGSHAAGPPSGPYAAGRPSGSYAAGPPSGSYASGPSGGSYAAGPPSGSYASGPSAGSYAVGPGAGAYAGAPQGDRADFQVGNQSAEQIHMAGRDINIRAERESFLADIAATKTRGRRLVLIGFLCVIVGFALFGYGVVSFIVGIPQIDMNSTQPQVPSPFGPDVLGVPLGVIGFALGGLGSVIVIAGIVLHVSAAARLRRLQNTAGPTRERPGFPW